MVDPERYEVKTVGEDDERVLAMHARACPVARSLEGGIEICTELEMV